jgi:hypothetical protein
MAHNTYEINSPVVTTEDAVLQINGEAHYIRFEVLALIEQSRSFMSHFGAPADVGAHIRKITTCIATITEYRREHEHSLWDILLDELNTCKRTLENRHLATTDTPQIMTQHAGYLGRMRGLPATMSQVHSGSGGYGDPASIPPPPTLVTRAFSNSAQRQISSQLCATVSGGAAHPTQTQDPYDVHSAALPPMPPMPPMPTGPLVRQIACDISSRSSSLDNK